MVVLRSAFATQSHARNECWLGRWPAYMSKEGEEQKREIK